MNPDQASGTDDDRIKERRNRKNQSEKERRAKKKAHVEAMEKRIGMLGKKNFHLSQTVSTLQEKNFHLSQTVSTLQERNFHFSVGDKNCKS
jgi:hypothetical protein